MSQSTQTQTVQLNIPLELYQQLQKQAKKQKKSISGLLINFITFYKEKNDWQKLEAEADEDLMTGRFEEFNNMDELIKDIDS